mmetsp:Transcript_50784/g.129234  ORF Transcript_50784/g.129234 Transcript_50784/m.129234 type:complete len:82 (-) Transcript_50784:240-485(-)
MCCGDCGKIRRVGFKGRFGNKPGPKCPSDPRAMSALAPRGSALSSGKLTSGRFATGRIAGSTGADGSPTGLSNWTPSRLAE